MTVTVEPLIEQWFDECYSIRYRNYAVADDYLHAAEEIPTVLPR